MEQKKTGKGTIVLGYLSLAMVVVGLAMKCKNSFSEGNSGSGQNPFSCSAMDKFTSDSDVINALAGTWVMENEDYYGKYKIQFSGNSATVWKMDAGTTEWKDHGNMTLEEVKKYVHITKMNQGPEYHISYDAEIGSMSFDINCIGGLTIASDRFPEYGISFIKQ